MATWEELTHAIISKYEDSTLTYNKANYSGMIELLKSRFSITLHGAVLHTSIKASLIANSSLHQQIKILTCLADAIDAGHDITHRLIAIENCMNTVFGVSGTLAQKLKDEVEFHTAFAKPSNAIVPERAHNVLENIANKTIKLLTAAGVTIPTLQPPYFLNKNDKKLERLNKLADADVGAGNHLYFFVESGSGPLSKTEIDNPAQATIRFKKLFGWPKLIDAAGSNTCTNPPVPPNKEFSFDMFGGMIDINISYVLETTDPNDIMQYQQPFSPTTTEYPHDFYPASIVIKIEITYTHDKTGIIVFLKNGRSISINSVCDYVKYLATKRPEITDVSTEFEKGRRVKKSESESESKSQLQLQDHNFYILWINGTTRDIVPSLLFSVDVISLLIVSLKTLGDQLARCYLNHSNSKNYECDLPLALGAAPYSPSWMFTVDRFWNLQQRWLEGELQYLPTKFTFKKIKNGNGVPYVKGSSIKGWMVQPGMRDLTDVIETNLIIYHSLVILKHIIEGTEVPVLPVLSVLPAEHSAFSNEILLTLKTYYNLFVKSTHVYLLCLINILFHKVSDNTYYYLASIESLVSGLTTFSELDTLIKELGTAAPDANYLLKLNTITKCLDNPILLKLIDDETSLVFEDIHSSVSDIFKTKCKRKLNAANTRILSKFSNKTAVPINNISLIELLKQAYSYLYNNNQEDTVPIPVFAGLIGLVEDEDISALKTYILEQKIVDVTTPTTSSTTSPITSPITTSPTPFDSGLLDSLLDEDEEDEEDDEAEEPVEAEADKDATNPSFLFKAISKDGYPFSSLMAIIRKRKTPTSLPGTEVVDQDTFIAKVREEIKTHTKPTSNNPSEITLLDKILDTETEENKIIGYELLSIIYTYFNKHNKLIHSLKCDESIDKGTNMLGLTQLIRKGIINVAFIDETIQFKITVQQQAKEYPPATNLMKYLKNDEWIFSESDTSTTLTGPIETEALWLIASACQLHIAYLGTPEFKKTTSRTKTLSATVSAPIIEKYSALIRSCGAKLYHRYKGSIEAVVALNAAHAGTTTAPTAPAVAFIDRFVDAIKKPNTSFSRKDGILPLIDGNLQIYLQQITDTQSRNNKLKEHLAAQSLLDITNLLGFPLTEPLITFDSDINAKEENIEALLEQLAQQAQQPQLQAQLQQQAPHAQLQQQAPHAHLQQQAYLQAQEAEQTWLKAQQEQLQAQQAYLQAQQAQLQAQQAQEAQQTRLKAQQEQQLLEGLEALQLQPPPPDYNPLDNHDLAKMSDNEIASLFVPHYQSNPYPIPLKPDHDDVGWKYNYAEYAKRRMPRRDVIESKLKLFRPATKLPATESPATESNDTHSRNPRQRTNKAKGRRIAKKYNNAMKTITLKKKFKRKVKMTKRKIRTNSKKLLQKYGERHNKSNKSNKCKSKNRQQNRSKKCRNYRKNTSIFSKTLKKNNR